MIAALDAKLTWYAARASGMVAWGVVTASVVWGLALSTRFIRRKGAPAWLLDVHTFLGTLSLVFVAVHVLALWADNFVYFGPRELFVPFASPWRAAAVAWGIVATYLLAAIELSSWMMKRLPRRLWHVVHVASLPLFVAATVHGFTAGADAKNAAVQWVCVTCCVLVAMLVTRVLTRRRAPMIRPAASGERIACRYESSAPVSDAPVRIH